MSQTCRTQFDDLETRRISGNLIETFQIMKGLEDVDYSSFFSLSGGVLRGHSSQDVLIHVRIFSLTRSVIVLL